MGVFESKVPLTVSQLWYSGEVAQECKLVPGTKSMGHYLLQLQFYAKPEIAMYVPPTCFMPQPKVGSAVIKLVRHEKGASRGSG